MAANSTSKRKYEKPRPDFPLSIHQGSGYWCRKVHGRVYYFGKVADDPKGVAALKQWLDEKDDLFAGREPRLKVEGALVVGDLCNRFLAVKESLRDNGELSPRTFLSYHSTCAIVVKVLGRNRAVTDIMPDDLRKLRGKLAETRGLVALRNAITRVRSIFKFAFDEGLIDKPVRYGQGFNKPSKEKIDIARESRRARDGEQMFEADELRAILAKCKNPLRAMVLLGANCAFGQTDIANLPTRAVNLETGWVDFGRTKTGVARKIPLWPETIEAIREWLPVRPKAKQPEDGPLLFITRRGAKFLRLNADGHHIDGIGQEFGKVIKKLELARPRRAFYSLRHGFETIGGETGDQVAVDKIMGHKDGSMAAHYRERISDDRLRRVTDFVRAWLFDLGDDGEKAPAPDSGSQRVANSPDSCDPPECNETENGRPRLRIVG